VGRASKFVRSYFTILAIAIFFAIFVAILALIAFLPIAIHYLLCTYAKTCISLTILAVMEILWLPIGIMIDAKILNSFIVWGD